MSGHYLKDLAKEDKELFGELASSLEKDLTPESAGEILRKCLGFGLKESRCFIPSIACGQTWIPLTALIPIYDTIIAPVSPTYSLMKASPKGIVTKKIRKASEFEKVHGLTLSNMVKLAEKSRVIPYFTAPYDNYDENTIKSLIEPGIARISYGSMMLLRNAGRIIVIGERISPQNWGESLKLANADVTKLDFQSANPKSCVTCLAMCYALGSRKHFLESKFSQFHACFLSYALSNHVLDSLLQVKCPIASEVLSSIGNLPEEIPIEYILKGLRVEYSEGLAIEEYAEVFDGKTSKALRRIIWNLYKDPLSKKYSERLSAKIHDLNQQVEELAESKAAKIFETISDMAIYGGEKFIESQTQRYIKIPKKGLIRLGEWLASKGVDVTTKVHGKDWSVAQLHRARCKLKKCRPSG